MNRRVFFSGILTLVAVIMLSAAPSAAIAQPSDTCCEQIIIAIDDNVSCRVRLCLRIWDAIICDIYQPGTTSTFPISCNTEFSGVEVTDICGNTYVIPPDSCRNNIRIGNNCCVKICLTRSALGCYVVRVTGVNGCVPCPSDLGDLRRPDELFVRDR